MRAAPPTDPGPLRLPARGMLDDGSTVAFGGDDTGGAEVVPLRALSPALDAAHPHLPIVPRTRYSDGHEIGRGGLGRVCAVNDLRLGREVAIKELHDDREPVQARFLREALITARLEHPSIVPIYEAGYWPDGTPFYAMKRLSGRTLDELIAETSSLPDRLDCLGHIISVVDAIAYAHSKGVIHRDLKPSNVIVAEFGETVVVDWGLAKALDDTLDSRDAGSPSLSDIGDDVTMAGAVLGTPRYMAPEQAAGSVVDERADIYALGALLYHLCAGEAPHPGTTPREVLYRLMLEPPPPVSERVPELPEDLAAIVNKAMARNPDQRYASALTLGDDLRRFQNGQRVSAHAYSLSTLFGRWLRRHRALVTVIAAAVTLLAATAAVSVWRIVRESEIAHARMLDAQAARERERERNHELVVVQAGHEQDATAAAAWLKTLPVDAAVWGPARLVALTAKNRGIARHVWHDHDGVTSGLVLSPDGSLLATTSLDRTAVLRNLTTGTRVRLVGHTAEVRDIAFAPDRPLAATSSGDGSVRLWDLAGNQVQVFNDDTSASLRVLFSPDGAYLATTYGSGTVRLRHLDSGAVRVFEGHQGEIWAIAFSPDGSTLASADFAGGVRTWSVTGDAPDRVLPSHDDRVRQVAFSPDGALLASASHDGQVRLWRSADGSLAMTLAHAAGVVQANFSPDGDQITTASRDGSIHVWDLASGADQVLGHHGGVGYSARFSPDGRLVASSAADGTVRVWEPATGLERRTFEGESDMVLQVRFSPDSTRLWSVGRNTGVREWALDQVTNLRLHHGGNDDVTAIEVAPDGRAVVAGHVHGAVELWDPATGQASEIARHGGQVMEVAFSPDGTLVASAGTDGQLYLRDRERAITRLLGTHDDEIVAMVFFPDGRHIATGSYDHTVGLWDLETAQHRRLEGHDGHVRALAVSPDGRYLASTGSDGTIRLWTVATGASKQLGRHDSSVGDLAFSPDGALLASAGDDREVRLWPIAGGPTRVLRGHRHEIAQVSFSPDGQRLASRGITANDIIIWDLATGAPHRLDTHASRGLVWISDDSLATVNEDGTTRLWDVNTGESQLLHRLPVAAADAIAISPDRTRLATGDRYQNVHLWYLDVPEEPEALRAWLDQVTSAELGPGRIPRTPPAP